MTTSPTIVMVPGGYHVDSCMNLLGAELQKRGYNTRTWQLISVNKPNVSVEDDVKAFVEGLLFPLIEEQAKDVVLYLHSYAGLPGSGAIAGLSKAERMAKHKRGGVMGLIYLSAFIPRSGDTILQMSGGKYPSWQNTDVRSLPLLPTTMRSLFSTTAIDNDGSKRKKLGLST
ncbi:MAG: hypothetical protein Q9217_006506 [Psora testacea]